MLSRRAVCGGLLCALMARRVRSEVALDALGEQISNGVFPNVHAVVALQNGQQIFERYRAGEDEVWGQSLGVVDHMPDTLHDIRSVTKSITSLLLGIALRDNFEEAIAQPIQSFLPQTQKINPDMSDITLHHVLTMTAGLDWNEMEVPYTSPDNDEIRLSSTVDPVGLVMARNSRTRPGEAWYYNGGLTQIVAAVIEHLTDRPFLTFADEALFAPMGIEQYLWMRPHAWPEDHAPSAASGLRMTARDLSRIGQLVLDRGMWQGRAIVPAGWIEISTTRHVADTPWGPPGMYGYGYFWFPGQLPTGHSVIRAVGNGDQRLFVVPEIGLSLAVLAGNYNDFRHAVGERILAAAIDEI
ncbi:MAG: serine hydrolase [Pseudomonadota bacterium]